MRPLILSAILALTATGAARRTSQDKDAEEIKAAMVQMWAAEEAGDLDKYASFVHPDFTQFGETAAYLSQGRDTEVRSMGEYLKHATGVHTEMHNPLVTIRGDVAWVTYYWSDEGMVDGKRMTSHGKSTRIFVKEHGKWLCIHGHYTLGP